MSLALIIANAADTLTFLGLAGQIAEANPLVAALPVPVALTLRWTAVLLLAFVGRYFTQRRRIVLLGAGVVFGMIGFLSNVAALPDAEYGVASSNVAERIGRGIIRDGAR